jgi:hypothetical protein
MRQGRSFLPVCLALALGLASGAAISAATPAFAAAKKSDVAAKSAKARNALHQFTGTLTTFDATTLTVEKRGKNPRTLVFTRHDGMKTVGELEKDARVTVFYRDEGGRVVAHRVVVKPGSDTSGDKG